MRSWRRWRRRLAAGVGVPLAALAVVLVATDLPEDSNLYPPKPGARTVAVFVVSNGFHTGLAVPRPELAEVARHPGESAVTAVTQRFDAYDFIEFGWGEDMFYRSTPTIGAFRWRLAFHALFEHNQTVVHVVGLSQPPQISFAGATIARIVVSDEGFRRMAARLDGSFARDGRGGVIEVGPGLYGPSLFYRATGETGPFNVCNNWIGRLLNAAGVPNSPILTTAAGGLFADLRFRSGVGQLSTVH